MIPEASCQRCRATAKRGMFISHRPACDLDLREAGCLEADLARPCRFLATCSETRRRQMVAAGLRGTACWAFAQLIEKLGPDPAGAADRAAIPGETA